MVIFGIDAHKRSHTVVVIDEQGRKLAERTTTHTSTADHIDLRAGLSGSTRIASGRSRTVDISRGASRRIFSPPVRSSYAYRRSSWLTPATVRERMGNPIRSMRWRLPELRCVNPVFLPPIWTKKPARCGCS